MHQCILYQRPIRSSSSTQGRKGALEEAGRTEQHIITEAAPNELKLGMGVSSDGNWPSARQWRRGVFVRRRLRSQHRGFGVF